MLRSCPKCGNRNHISAFVCPCGYQLIATPEPKLHTVSERTAAPLYQETFPPKPPDLPKQPLPQPAKLLLHEELEKQAIREALLVEEQPKPASGKLKINFKRSFVAVILAILLGAMLAVLGGFTGVTENSEAKQDENQQASLADKNPAPGAQNLAANNAAGERQGVEGKVIDVGSGDTLTVADGDNQQYEIKLEGIDAPELGQDFGREAQRNLFTLLFGKTVQVSWREPGAGGLTVGRVLVNGKNASLEQLKAGLAWHDRSAALEQSENDLYAYHETINKRNSFGLWSAANPLPPWEYRGRPENPNQGESQAVASDTNGENQVIVSDARGEMPEAAPNAEPEAKTKIYQETRNAVESQTASTEIVSKPAYMNSPPSTESPPPVSPPPTKLLPPVSVSSPVKSNTSVGVSSPPQKPSAVVPTGYERKPPPVSPTPPAKTPVRGENNKPAAQRAGDCFVIEKGKKVYLERELCGN